MASQSSTGPTYTTNTSPSDIPADAYQRRMAKQKKAPVASSMSGDPTLDSTSNVSSMRQKIGY